jgi:hypothetical protein
LTIIGYRVHDSRLVGGVPFFFSNFRLNSLY